MNNRLTFFNYKITNTGDVCDIYIDGAIVDASTQEVYEKWFDDTTPTSFKSLRNQISKDAKTVNVYINSGGGQVVEAMAIHDYLVQLQSNGITVKTYGRGLIASAATYILMASKNSTISKNSWFMIHNVSGGVWGDVNQVENYARTLRNFNDTVTSFYATTTGLSETVIGNMMNKETWLNGEQAKEKGFVNHVESSQTFSNAINTNQWQFSNHQVLAAYNLSTKSFPEMNIKESVMNALKELGIIKNETDTTNYEAIANAVEKAVGNDLEERIKTAVDNATKGIADSISNAVTEATKNLLSKDDIKDLATHQSVTDAVKKVSDELETVKGDFANKSGGEAGDGKKKNEMDTTGISWVSN